MPPSRENSHPVLLEMDQVAVASAHVPGATVIDQVDWVVRPGDYWVIGGLPASGKSDLLATGAGLLRPGQGTVRLFGRDLSHLDDRERSGMQLRVGVVFGSGGRLFNDLNVTENLALPFCYHRNCAPGASEARVSVVLETLELTGVARRLPPLINRNMRQRVALARALVLAPELLFLDNPLVGLDPRESRWWLAFLGKLGNGHPVLEGRRVTLVVGTDDLQPWSDCGKQFAYIDQRRFRTAGGRTDLVKEASPVLRELLTAAWPHE